MSWSAGRAFPAGARELLASAEGCRLLTEVLTVEPGYERAVAAALGSLAQAVVWGDPSELSLALEVDGPFEAIRESGLLGQAAGSKAIGAATPAGSGGAPADLFPRGLATSGKSSRDPTSWSAP